MYEVNKTMPLFFWGKEPSTRMGRDPLAVQNSSVVIYSNIVRGITNVTARVRYNGFFCWIISFIAERLYKINPNLKYTTDELIRYIRRGELLLAYEMVYNYPQVGGVSGSLFVQQKMSEGVLNLAKGADIENKPEKLYWENSRGIFGQYYVGVLTELGLIRQPSGGFTYKVTPDGERLGKIFGESLSESQKDIFWNAIYKGTIEKEILAELKGISLHIIDNEKELSEYTRVFCQPDGKDMTGRDLFRRLKTIRLLMRFISGDGNDIPRNKLVLSFLRYNFLDALNSAMEVSEEQMSWFLYELNELSHAAYEAFHFALLYTVKDEPQPLDLAVSQLQGEYESSRSDVEIPQDIYGLYEKMQESYADKDYGALLLTAAELLIVLYRSIKDFFTTIGKYSEPEGYDNQNGYAPILLKELVGVDSQENNWFFVEGCLVNAINDHLRSSYAKSTEGQGIVHNYMFEDGLIWRMRVTFPIRTSPRLQNVLQYIEDLKWIERREECYDVTERGQKILV